MKKKIKRKKLKVYKTAISNIAMMKIRFLGKVMYSIKRFNRNNLMIKKWYYLKKYIMIKEIIVKI